jgi:hypothetical protein
LCHTKHVKLWPYRKIIVRPVDIDLLKHCGVVGLSQERKRMAQYLCCPWTRRYVWGEAAPRSLLHLRTLDASRVNERRGSRARNAPVLSCESIRILARTSANDDWLSCDANGGGEIFCFLAAGSAVMLASESRHVTKDAMSKRVG